MVAIRLHTIHIVQIIPTIAIYFPIEFDTVYSNIVQNGEHYTNISELANNY